MEERECRGALDEEMHNTRCCTHRFASASALDARISASTARDTAASSCFDLTSSSSLSRVANFSREATFSFNLTFAACSNATSACVVSTRVSNAFIAPSSLLISLQWKSNIPCIYQYGSACLSVSAQEHVWCGGCAWLYYYDQKENLTWNHNCFKNITS